MEGLEYDIGIYILINTSVLIIIKNRYVIKIVIIVAYLMMIYYGLDILGMAMPLFWIVVCDVIQIIVCLNSIT